VDELEIASPAQDDQMLALTEALDRFAALEPRQAELVKLRYFLGLIQICETKQDHNTQFIHTKAPKVSKSDPWRCNRQRETPWPSTRSLCA
jgi:hypothetical protein